MQGVFDAWNRRDYAAAQAAHDPRIEVEMSTESVVDGTYRGYEGLRELMRFWGAFADFHSEITELREAADDVFISAHHWGRGKSSGVEVEMENWQVFTLRDGRIVRYRVFGSRDRALAAAGLSE